MFPPTYHEGTIIIIYMSHWHRAIYFIVNLVVYCNDTWIEGIHILIVSLSSHLLFKLVMGLLLVNL